MTEFDSVYDDGLLPRPLPRVNEENIEIVHQFRDREDVQMWLKDWHNDDFMARWLVARDWNLDKAAAMYCESMKWREENDIDNITEWFPKTPNYDKVMSYWPSSRARGQLTVEGLPVYYERIGVVDAKELLSTVNDEDLINFHIYEQECRELLARELYEEHGFTAGTIFIQDLSGIGMKNLYRPGLNLISKLSEIDKANYPEIVRKMFLINAPTVFPLVWKIGKAFFDPDVIKKFSIHSDNGYSIFSRILPEDEIPIFAGGTKEGVAPGGKGHNWRGTREINIPRSDTYIKQFEVKEAGSEISYYFDCDRDIKFSINYEGSIILDLGKVKKHEGSVIAEETGTYQLVFDNTYSWTKSKTINYKKTVYGLEQ
eukprot:TRINITY_DN11228_c0_g1_i1.p1 TRINITY_DN11228_c0_g1~~TRINITY_DN11228_c0_g1_i1.p1  ORF type:complete len:371 (-),score=85.00 TRINITY_DN11228_c0_g1_i1:58-1170(-)